jgi:hypothetical protein
VAFQRNGELSREEATLSVQPCAAGTAGLAACASCIQGRYSAAPGQQQCLLCDPGRFANKTAMSFCYQCPPGSAALNPESSSCQP